MTRLNLQPTLGKTVEHWLGTERHETDMVLEIMEELAREQEIDLEEASIEQVRKLADEAFEYCEEERWFKDH
jgi:hypothetical protein